MHSGVWMMADDLRETARFFHALRGILRLRILLTLAEQGEMNVTRLAQELRVSQPLVSFHLRPLRALDLILVRREGREAYCSLNLPEIERCQKAFMDALRERASKE